jgi:hypothetical protein
MVTEMDLLKLVCIILLDDLPTVHWPFRSGVLGFGIFLIIAIVRKYFLLAMTPVIPSVTTLPLEEVQFQTATLNDLREGVIPHLYHLSGFLPNKGESVIWAFFGVRHYSQERIPNGSVEVRV